MLWCAVGRRGVSGLGFGDGATGRRARVMGTGLDVFEIARTYRNVDHSWERLRTAYDWLSEPQLRAALAYAEAFAEEIEERLREEGRWTREAIWATYPFMRPPSPPR